MKPTTGYTPKKLSVKRLSTSHISSMSQPNLFGPKLGGQSSNSNLYSLKRLSTSHISSSSQALLYGPESRNIWDSVLLPLNNEIPKSVIEMYLSFRIKEDELSHKGLMIYSYFNANWELKEFLKYIVQREVADSFDNSKSVFKRLSPFVMLINIFIDNELSTTITEVTSIFCKYAQKDKNMPTLEFIRDPSQNSSINKIISTIHSILSDVFKKLLNPKAFSPPLQYLLYTIHSITHQVGIDSKQILFTFMFQRPLETMARSFTEQQPTYIAPVRVLIYALTWLLNDKGATPQELYWKKGLRKTCSSEKTMVEKWYKTITKYTESKIYLITWKDLPSQDILPQELEKDWRKLEKYLPEETFSIIQNHYVDKTDFSTSFKKTMDEFNRLRLNHFIEKSEYLSKMTHMKMKIKDLKEEIRYLKDLVENKKPIVEQNQLGKDDDFS